MQIVMLTALTWGALFGLAQAQQPLPSPCTVARQEAATKGLYKPDCRADGTFASRQYVNGTYYCSDRFTGELSSDLTACPIRGTADTSDDDIDQAPADTQQFTDDEKEATQRMEEATENKKATKGKKNATDAVTEPAKGKQVPTEVTKEAPSHETTKDNTKAEADKDANENKMKATDESADEDLERHNRKSDDEDTERLSRKSDDEDRERRGHKSDDEDRERRGRKFDDEDRERRGRKSDDEDRERRGRKSDDEDRERHGRKSDDEDRERRGHKSDDDDTERHGHKFDDEDRERDGHENRREKDRDSKDWVLRGDNDREQHGEVDRMQAVVSGCFEAYQEAVDGRLVLGYVPQCMEDGSFAPMQCMGGGDCWCVDTATGDKQDVVLAECALCSRMRKALQAEAVDGWLPECNADGTFAERQCFGEDCYCFDRSTGELTDCQLHDDIHGTIDNAQASPEDTDQAPADAN